MSNAVQSNGGVIEPTLDTVITGIENNRKWKQRALVPFASFVIPADFCPIHQGRMANFYILAYDEIPVDKNIRVVTTIGKQST